MTTAELLLIVYMVSILAPYVAGVIIIVCFLFMKDGPIIEVDEYGQQIKEWKDWKELEESKRKEK